MKTARDYKSDLSVLSDEITPLPWSEFCESSDWWIGSAAEDGGPALMPGTGVVNGPVCGANEMSAQDMLYVVWAANTAPELVKALEMAEAQRDGLLAALEALRAAVKESHAHAIPSDIYVCRICMAQLKARAAIAKAAGARGGA